MECYSIGLVEETGDNEGCEVCEGRGDAVLHRMSGAHPGERGDLCRVWGDYRMMDHQLPEALDAELTQLMAVYEVGVHLEADLRDCIATALAETERRGMEKAEACCLAEFSEQGARRHEHSYYEGMEAGAYNCCRRIRALLPPSEGPRP